MIRGTTPTHVFTLPIDVNTLEKIRVIYSQNGREIVTKTEGDCQLDGNKITVKLSQRETLGMKSTANVEIQLRVLTNGGDALASQIMSVTPVRCLSDEVL